MNNQRANGGSGNDRLLGSDGNDVVNDVLASCGREDLLFYETGADRINGGESDEMMGGGNSADPCVLNELINGESAF